MFEQEISQTIQRITREILQDRTLLPLQEILEDRRIPNRLKAFFENEVHWWIYTDSIARTRDRRFDYSNQELTSLLNYLEGVQARHARFEREDFLSTLDSGVKLTYNYICRPQTTLKWFVFRGEPTKGLGETLLRMNAFIDYPYFVTVFNEWVERKRAERPAFDSISSREFERIIRRIDDQILLSCTIDELLEIMDPLFSFLGEGEEQRVPIEALIVYFDDKNIQKLVDFLDEIAERHEYITPESFAHLIEELLVRAEGEPEADFSSVYQDDALDDVVRRHLGEGSGSDGVELPSEPEEDLIPPIPVPVPATAEPTPEDPPENTPGDAVQVIESDRNEDVGETKDVATVADGAETGKKEEKRGEEREEKKERKEERKKDRAEAKKSPGVHDSRTEEKESTPESPETGPSSELNGADIRSRIDPTLERKVLKKIFGQDRSKYELFLDQVNGTDSWRKASHLLDQLFLDNEIDPYSRTAIRFTDMVYGRFIGG